jgi:hypothetical protein
MNYDYGGLLDWHFKGRVMLAIPVKEVLNILLISCPSNMKSGLYGIIAKFISTTISMVQVTPSLVKHNCSQSNFLLILY